MSLFLNPDLTKYKDSSLRAMLSQARRNQKHLDGYPQYRLAYWRYEKQVEVEMRLRGLPIPEAK